jgi:hypothetical protein
LKRDPGAAWSSRWLQTENGKHRSPTAGIASAVVRAIPEAGTLRVLVFVIGNKRERYRFCAWRATRSERSEVLHQRAENRGVEDVLMAVVDGLTPIPTQLRRDLL